MTNAMHGSKDLRKAIEKLAMEINSSELLPDQVCRRNGANYPYFCYVNNVFCLFYSKNYDLTPVFISRAVEHDRQFEPQDVFSLHRKKCRELILMITKYVDLYTESDFSHIESLSNDFYSEYIASKSNA